MDATESFLIDAPERERTTSEVGELIMEQLKGLDTVAYIRFASVYRDFKDVREFKEELEGLLGSRTRQGQEDSLPAFRCPLHRTGTEAFAEGQPEREPIEAGNNKLKAGSKELIE